MARRLMPFYGPSSQSNLYISFFNNTVYSLNTHHLVAGTKYVAIGIYRFDPCQDQRRLL